MRAVDRDDEEIQYLDVYRALKDPVYRVRFFFIRLTDGNLMVSILVAMTVWFVIDNTGTGQWSAVGELLTLDPWGWIGSGVLAAMLFSLLHKLRPEGNTEQIVRGLRAPKLLAARTRAGDRFWSPGDGRIYRKLMVRR